MQPDLVAQNSIKRFGKLPNIEMLKSATLTDFATLYENTKLAGS